MVIRAIHFVATAITAGSLVFAALVASALPAQAAVAGRFRAQTLRVAWIGLTIALLSGGIWLLLQAMSMSGLPLREAMTSNVLSTVLNETQFGQVSEIRVGLAIVLAICLACDRIPPAPWLALAAALGLIAAIAWTGHAASTLGDTAGLHLAADALHLIAASCWIGGLVSLVLLLGVIRRQLTTAWEPPVRLAVLRFSQLGIASVGTLLLTGLVNAWILVGSFYALVVTEYGRLLMLKIAVFAMMLALAFMNRFWLTPRLDGSPDKETGREAVRQLTRNSVIEIALGVVIFVIVGLLGTLHPAIHLQ